MKKTIITALAALTVVAAMPAKAEASSFSLSIGSYAPTPYAYDYGYYPHTYYHPPVRVVKYYNPRPYYVSNTYYRNDHRDRHHDRGHGRGHGRGHRH